MAQREGFGIPGAKPTRDHNPGDLEHGPHIHSWDGAIGIEPDDDAGWDDLERQLRIYAERGMTIREMVMIYAPPDENDAESYLSFICFHMGCEPSDYVVSVLGKPAEHA